MSRNDSKIGRTVLYAGRVQGVGFRATAHAIAAEFKVVGWVKNLPDGRVELYIEGKASQVAGFVAKIRSTMARNIQNEVFNDREPTGRFKRFEIEY